MCKRVNMIHKIMMKKFINILYVLTDYLNEL